LRSDEAMTFTGSILAVFRCTQVAARAYRRRT
jgi:hypothetical protein